MLTFKQLLENAVLNKITPSLESIARKHKQTMVHMMKQLDIGMKVELEHTTDAKVAEEIALDHLNERPDYYIRLVKSVE